MDLKLFSLSEKIVYLSTVTIQFKVVQLNYYYIHVTLILKFDIYNYFLT